MYNVHCATYYHYIVMIITLDMVFARGSSMASETLGVLLFFDNHQLIQTVAQW